MQRWICVWERVRVIVARWASAEMGESKWVSEWGELTSDWLIDRSGWRMLSVWGAGVITCSSYSVEPPPPASLDQLVPIFSTEWWWTPIQEGSTVLFPVWRQIRIRRIHIIFQETDSNCFPNLDWGSVLYLGGRSANRLLSFSKVPHKS